MKRDFQSHPYFHHHQLVGVTLVVVLSDAVAPSGMS